MQATDARRAFPCWDEPSLKARFDVTLRVPKNRTALSNMPPKNEAPSPGLDGWKDVRFETTPIMSTYLVAFCVGEFDVVEGQTAENVAVRVWTPPGLKEQGRFALDVACKTLSFFTKFFDQPYPLPKMDMARRRTAHCDALRAASSRCRLGHVLCRHLFLYYLSDKTVHFLPQVAVPDFAAGAMENWRALPRVAACFPQRPCISARFAADTAGCLVRA